MRRGLRIFDADTHLTPMAETLAAMVTDFLGNGVLTYSSDYPGAECRFPESTAQVFAWKSPGDEAMRKMFWDNASDALASPRPRNGAVLVVRFGF